MKSEKRLDEIRAEAEKRGTVAVPSYYGQPLLKPPVWTWEVPTYFFVGGMAGAAAVIGLVARGSGAGERLVQDARWTAAIGAALSAPLLIADLGRPERFLNMLRVFKPQSPMSVGVWILSVFGASSTAAILLRGRYADAAASISALTGLGMSTYTGVLLGVTALPVWSQHAGVLPAHFAASSVGAAASALELRGHRHRALNLLALSASAFETVAAPRVARVGELLSGPVAAVLRLAGRRRAAAAITLFGSLLTRLEWVEAGRRQAATQRVPDKRSENDKRDGNTASRNPMPAVSKET